MPTPQPPKPASLLRPKTARAVSLALMFGDRTLHCFRLPRGRQHRQDRGRTEVGHRACNRLSRGRSRRRHRAGVRSPAGCCTRHQVDSVEGFWNTGRDEGRPNLGYKIRPKIRLLPGAAARHPDRPPLRDGAHHGRARHSRSRSITTRSAPPVSARSTCASTRCSRWPTTPRPTSTSSRTPQPSTARSRPSCRSRSLPTTAPACTSTSRSGRTARTCSPSRDGYAGLSESAL